MNITNSHINHENTYIKMQPFCGKIFSKSNNIDDTFENKNKTNPKQHKVRSFFNKFKGVIIAGISSVITALSVIFIMDKKNKQIVEANKNLKNELNNTLLINENLKKELNNIVLPKDFESTIDEKAEEIFAKSLEYDPLTPYESTSISDIESKKIKPVTVEMSKEPEHTSNRADAHKLDYPKFKPNTYYKFEFPDSKEIKITKTEPVGFEEQSQLTNISENYANSLQWNNDKIARDILQNFFDGHGQTLDGVKIEIIPEKNGKHKVKISGKSTYNFDKAIMLGETTKKDNVHAAGNYGEGLKMVVLKLLKEKGAENVNIASNNWNVKWNLVDNNINDNKVLKYTLSKSDFIDGNYLEFETDNLEFIKSILNSYDRFYHYNNPAFKEPEFENDIIGIKFMKNPKEKGKIFIAGQAFEVSQDTLGGKNSSTYDGINGLNIFIKERPPKESHGSVIFDTSRDRIALNYKNIQTLGKWLAENDNLSDEDFTKLLNALHPCWESGKNAIWSNNYTEAVFFLNGLLDHYCNRSRRLNIIFPNEKEIAYSYLCSSWSDLYENAGYKMCNPGLNQYGMNSIEELIAESKAHNAIKPSIKEEKKIKILKEAIKILSPVLKENNFFTDDELNAKIYLFDNTATNENRAYNTVQGESITSNGECKGFWIDTNTLDEKNFSELLSICLHELTHKYGSDDSDVFSYKLTDVIEMLTKAMTKNPNLALQLKALEEIWNKI